MKAPASTPAPTPPVELRRAVDVEGRRYAAAARKLADRQAELVRVVTGALDGGASPQQVAVWLGDVVAELPAEIADLLR